MKNNRKIVEIKDEYSEWKKCVDWCNLTPQKRMELLEGEGIFDIDINDDPPTYELLPGDIDYTHSKFITKVKSKIANIVAQIGIRGFIKKGQLIIKEVKGLENWKNLKTGAIVTCNHFSPNDSFILQRLLKYSKHKKLFRVIKEGNYTNPPVLKFFMRNCDVLPLSSNMQTMKKFLRSVNQLLSEGKHILIYPEQCMWPNYRKPRPLKDGAFSFAVKNNVPVLPIFITMEDVVGKNGQPNIAHTVHILEPIYPDINLGQKERIEDLKNKNYNAWVEVYEKTYGVKLEYNIKDKTI